MTALQPIQKDLFPHSSFDLLALELWSEVCLHLRVSDLAKLSLVDRNLHKLIQDQYLWLQVLYRDNAFGMHQWERHLGDDISKDIEKGVDFHSLPNDIVKILKQPCPNDPTKSVFHTHILVYIPKSMYGEPVNLNNFAQIIRKKFPHQPEGYESSVFENGHVSQIDSSSWVVMTKKILNDSLEQTHSCLTQKVTNLSSINTYRIPTTIEAAVCVLANYITQNRDRIPGILIGQRQSSQCEWMGTVAIRTL